MRGRTPVALAAAAGLLFSAIMMTMPGPSTVSAAGRYRVRSERVAPGLRLLRITDRRGPNRIRVLKLDPASPLALHMELANDEIPDHETTSSMAVRNRAIAAINGDYTMLPSEPTAGRPVHTFASDLELVTSPLVYGRNFSQSVDESAVYIGHPKFRAWLTQSDSGEEWQLNTWNEVPAPPKRFSVYTMKGGWNHKPPLNACAARLYPSEEPSLAAQQPSVEQDYTVSVVRCAYKRLARKGGVVVAAPRGTTEALAIEGGLVPGEVVTLGWTTGWPGVGETIGGNPTLLEDGVITAERCTGSYFCYRNPRTGIGVNKRGKILLVTVDGRRKRSVGMTPVQFARLFRWLGATSGLNLDGGGSTTMWVRGEIVNRPSGSSERPVGSAVLVVPGPVPEPTPSPTPLPTPSLLEDLPHAAASTDGLGDGCDALTDPGSTGGLLDYLAREHGSGFAKGAFKRALQVYRSGPCTESMRTRS